MVRTWIIDYGREELAKTRPHNEKVIWKLPLDIVKRIESVKDFDDVSWHFYKTVKPYIPLDELNKMSMDEIFALEDFAILFPDEEYNKIIELSKQYRNYKDCSGYYDKENAKRIFGDYWNNEKALEI